ncbi:AraC family transcriptional regulator [Flavobacteriaceae bacterium]|nr:AraC family transcriptional regulator [Flavobacteriaceae bacterium]
MDIYPVYLLLFVLTIVIVRLFRLLNDENKFNLRYLIIHFLFQALTLINMSFYLKYDIKIPLIIITSGRVFVFIFFLLYLKSIIENKRSRVTFVYFIPCLVLLLVDNLNASGIRLFTFVDKLIVQENILGFNSSSFVGKDDVFVVSCINTSLFTGLILNKFYQLLRSELLSIKNKIYIYDLLIYYYLAVTTISFSTLLILGLSLINIKWPIVMIITKLLGIISILFLIIKPGLLSRVSRVKNSIEIDENLKIIYHNIKSFLLKNNSFLDSNFNLASISAKTGIRSELVRNSIKEYSNMNVPMFINSYRINYSIKLIDEGYLKNFSMEGLAEKSGFNSQENFNRVFKLLNSITPTQYLNSKQ